MRIVDIPTGRPYQALIGRGLLDSLGEKTAQVHAPCRAVIVTDSGNLILSSLTPEALAQRAEEKNKEEAGQKYE